MKINKAFTIVELLLYMALISVFVVVLVEIFVGVMKFQIRTKTLSSNEIDGRFIMQRLSYDFSRSTDLIDTASRYSLDVDGRLIFDGDFLSMEDTVIENLTFVPIGDTMQVKFKINNQDYQIAFQLR